MARTKITTRDAVSSPTFEISITGAELLAHDRWDAAYYQQHFRDNEAKLRRLQSVPLGEFIPEELPDGSKGITYGQVGARELSIRGTVRYLQVINIRDTGIDFAVKPDRVGEGTHNDPERSRVRVGDILFTNNAFRGTDSLIGRCVVVLRDYGRLNISQHIDRIRVVKINPFYVCAVLKSRFGILQVKREMHGVDAMTISFIRIRKLLIPPATASIQGEVENQYRRMSQCHERAMAVKERLLEESGIEPGQYGDEINKLAEKNSKYAGNFKEAEARLEHLIAELEAVLEGEQKRIRPFPN